VTGRILVLVEEGDVHPEDLAESAETKFGGEALGGGTVHPGLKDDEDRRDCGRGSERRKEEEGKEKKRTETYQSRR
jgi:hypothetical protein